MPADKRFCATPSDVRVRYRRRREARESIAAITSRLLHVDTVAQFSNVRKRAAQLPVDCRIRALRWGESYRLVVALALLRVREQQRRLTRTPR